MSKDLIGNKIEIFKGGPRSRFNACVGFNGDTDIDTYADGFFLAAKIIIAQILDDDARTPVDIAVYPILFNMRHATELSLKSLLSELVQFKPYRSEVNIEGSDLRKHAIIPLWGIFKENAIKTDNRYIPEIGKIDWIIQQVGNVDPTGQTFRYPHDHNKKHKHLEEYSLINIARIKIAFEQLYNTLDDLRHMTNILLKEYRLGTFTKKLSRLDIEKISTILPEKEKWVEESFDLVRDKIKQDYQLSSNELSKALNIIKGHYKFSTAIGLEKPLENLNLKDLIEFIKIWKRRKEHHDKIDDPFKSLFDKQENDTRTKEIIKLMELPLPSLNHIHALFYIGRENGACEQYGLYMRGFSDRLGEMITHLLNKTNFQDNIVHGLNIMGQKSILQEIKNSF